MFLDVFLCIHFFAFVDICCVSKSLSLTKPLLVNTFVRRVFVLCNKDHRRYEDLITKRGLRVLCDSRDLALF